MNSFLSQHVLVLNRLWQAVNVCTVRRALSLVFEGQAQVVFATGAGEFQTYNFAEWRDFSQRRPDPESINTIRSLPTNTMCVFSLSFVGIAFDEPRMITFGIWLSYPTFLPS